MLDLNGRDESTGINVWISFADLFAGLLLFMILGLIMILPYYREVRFSRELLKTLNYATETTRVMNDRLKEKLPDSQFKYSETEISIPEAALFKSFGYDDYLEDPQKLELLGTIRKAIREALDESGEQRKFLRVVIEGHTDNAPIRKEAITEQIPTNWELSSRRATGVLRFFKDGGMDSDEYNLMAVGLASTVPVSDNDTEEGKARNRRIVIRIEPDLKAIKEILSQ